MVKMRSQLSHVLFLLGISLSWSLYALYRSEDVLYQVFIMLGWCFLGENGNEREK